MRAMGGAEQRAEEAGCSVFSMQLEVFFLPFASASDLLSLFNCFCHREKL